jgi:hypothetical protein
MARQSLDSTLCGAGMVWSLFHYQKPSLDYDEKNYAAYKRVNQLYAQTLLKVLHPSMDNGSRALRTFTTNPYLYPI